MPKPPTAERGRRARTVVELAPSPERRTWLRRLIPAPAAASPATARRALPARGVDTSRLGAFEDRRVAKARHEPASQESDSQESASQEGGKWQLAEEWEDWEDEVSVPARRLGLSWRAGLTTLLCLVGLGMSIYLTIVHYGHYAAACVGGVSVISCSTVLHSPQSVIFGIPVPLLGIAYFVPMLALCSPPAWRAPTAWIALARLAGVVTGIGMVCYLVYTELFVIGKICLDCSSVHLVTLLLFVAVVTGWDEAMAPARGALAQPS